MRPRLPPRWPPRWPDLSVLFRRRRVCFRCRRVCLRICLGHPKNTYLQAYSIISYKMRNRNPWRIDHSRIRCRFDSVSWVVGMSFLRMNSRIGLSCRETSSSTLRSRSVPSAPRGSLKTISVQDVMFHCRRTSAGISSSRHVGRSQWFQDSPQCAAVCPWQ